MVTEVWTILFKRNTVLSFFFPYPFERERVNRTGGGAKAEGEAGSTQRAQCGTRSRDSRIMPWAEGRRSTTEPPRDPAYLLILSQDRATLYNHIMRRKGLSESQIHKHTEIALYNFNCRKKIQDIKIHRSWCQRAFSSGLLCSQYKYAKKSIMIS